MGWSVYIIECRARTGRVTVHVGVAGDVAFRVHEHACGKVRATRGRLVSWLGNSVRMPQEAALRVEMRLKKMSPMEKRMWAEQQKEHA